MQVLYGESTILNEVLSLNAQELFGHSAPRPNAPFLNEVLSLNAQECSPWAQASALPLSSMKS